MKIGLNMSGNEASDDKAAQRRRLQHTILNAKKGDWQARDLLAKEFHPLLTSLAEKRSVDDTARAKYFDAGKAGLQNAAKKYKPTVGPDKFRIFALDFIEASMDRVDGGGGFFSKLFGKK